MLDLSQPELGRWLQNAVSCAVRAFGPPAGGRGAGAAVWAGLKELGKALDEAGTHDDAALVLVMAADAGQTLLWPLVAQLDSVTSLRLLTWLADLPSGHQAVAGARSLPAGSTDRRVLVATLSEAERLGTLARFFAPDRVTEIALACRDDVVGDVR
jgi:hypothetical protein